MEKFKLTLQTVCLLQGRFIRIWIRIRNDEPETKVKEVKVNRWPENPWLKNSLIMRPKPYTRLQSLLNGKAQLTKPLAKRNNLNGKVQPPLQTV